MKAFCHSILQWGTLAIILGLVRGGTEIGWSQEAARAQAKGFRYAEPFPRPNEGKARYLLQGGEAVPLENSRMRIREPELQVFRVDGQREFLMRAPECVFDTKQRVVTSEGSIEVLFAGDRFQIGGKGYRIESDRMFLVISNDVRALIFNTNTNSPTEKHAPLEIHSESFEFDATNRHGVFFGPVKGEDDEIRFSCGKLSAQATGGAGGFDVIDAYGDVLIESLTGTDQATAQHAVYRQSDNAVELEDGVMWKRGNHQGQSDHLLVHRSDRNVEAEGNVRMKLPKGSLSLGGFFPAGTNSTMESSVTPNEKLVDMECDRFLSNSNLTEAIGTVRIAEGTNRLYCDSIKAFDDATNSTGRVVLAEGNVSVEQGGNAIRSDRALFTESNSIVLFTGKPNWSLARTRGKARRVTLNAAQGNVFADGDVEVEVPISGEKGSFLKLFPENVESPQPKGQVVLVFAREFDADEKRVTFVGSVNAHEAPITGHEPRLRSDRMEVTFAAEAEQIESIFAKENVIFEQGTPGITNGPAAYRRLESDQLVAQTLESGQLSEVVAEGNVKLSQPGSIGQGERAEYDSLRGVLRLSGNPTLTTPQAIISEAKVLIYDRGNERFKVSAPFKINLKQDAVRGIQQDLKGTNK